MTFEFTKNYKFTILNNENVWAKAANRVVNEKVPVDKAVDEMIARIKQSPARRLTEAHTALRTAHRARSLSTITATPIAAPPARRGACRPWQTLGH